MCVFFFSFSRTSNDCSLVLNTNKQINNSSEIENPKSSSYFSDTAALSHKKKRQKFILQLGRPKILLHIVIKSLS